MNIDLNNLKYADTLLKELLKGMHISDSQFEWFSDLERNHDEYQALFKKFGHSMIKDSRGFYYFNTPESSQALNSTSQSFSLIVMCIVDYYSNKGINPIQVFKLQEFSIHEFTELEAHYKELLDQKNLGTADAIENQFSQFFRYGFAEKKQNGSYAFLVPIHRFLDAIVEINKDLNEDEPRD